MFCGRDRPRCSSTTRTQEKPTPPVGLPRRSGSSVVRTTDAKRASPAALRGRSKSSSPKGGWPLADMYERSVNRQLAGATVNLFTCHMKWRGAYSWRNALLADRTLPPAGQAGRGAPERIGRSQTQPVNLLHLPGKPAWAGRRCTISPRADPPTRRPPSRAHTNSVRNLLALQHLYILIVPGTEKG